MNRIVKYSVIVGCTLGLIGVTVTTEKSTPPNHSLKKLAKDAYIWGYPLVVMQRSKQIFTKKGGTPLNSFKRFDNLVTPEFTDVVTPNVDTLYSTAWLDLKNEPLILEVPDTEDRYYVVQFLDAYTNSFKNIGKRATGTKPGKYFIAGPDWSGEIPKDMTLIQAPTNMVWVITRVLVDGPDDLEKARLVLKKITLKPLLGKFVERYSDDPAGTAQDVSKAGIGFFDELGAALINNDPPIGQQGMLKLFEPIGVGTGKTPSKEVEDEELKNLLAQAVLEGEQEIDARLKKLGAEGKNGWAFNVKTGAYGDDYLFRAAVAKQGLGANTADESLYPMAGKDSEGAKLTGAHKYAIHFDKGKFPPVDAFWSITAYDMNTRGLVPNTIKRYAISDRSKHLTYNEDGSLDIVIQHAQPREDANWLPVPEGPFYLVLRLYNPQKSIRDNTYDYPLIKKVQPPAKTA